METAPVPSPMTPPPPLSPPPAPVYTAAPPAEPPVTYQSGGLLGKFDWVEIFFMAAGLFAIFHIIDYYRHKTKEDKVNQATLAEVRQDQEKLTMQFNGLIQRLRKPRF